MLPYPEIDPVAFYLGPLKVHWYGMTYLLALGFAWRLALHRSKNDWSPISSDKVEDLIFYGTMGVFLGGRIGYAIFYSWELVLRDPLWLFRVWEGGMSFHGGLLGVILATYLLARRERIPFMRLLDFVAPLVPMGLALGRLGNFIGQELWGRSTSLPWGMVFPRDPLQLQRHPSQLYQFALEGLLLFFILLWFSSRPRPTYAVSGVFAIGYGLLRIFVEFFREPDPHIGFQAFGWLTRGQFLCIPLVFVGFIFIGLAYRKQNLEFFSGGQK